MIYTVISDVFGGGIQIQQEVLLVAMMPPEAPRI